MLKWVIVIAAGLSLSGCVLAPKGTRQEQHRIDDAGRAYEAPVEQRTLPEVPAPATWSDVLHRAFLANGDLEGAYFEWKAAIARIPQVANYPNTQLAPSFSYLFSPGRMKSWDRTTVNLQTDPSRNLMFPTKVAKQGQIALDQTREAGQRFAGAKFDLQQRVLNGYYDLALMEEKIRISQAELQLLKMLSDTAESRVKAGGNESDLLRAQTQYRLAEDELLSMQAQAQSMRAMLNGMLARQPDAPLVLPPHVPEPRRVSSDDATLIAVAVDRNPSLGELAERVKGRQDALSLAKMAYIPDINPFGGFTGSLSQTAGAMVMLPTNLPEIRGAIDESRAMLRSSEAMLRQARQDRSASFVAALYVMRNAERQARVFTDTILPRAQQSLDGARQAYATGTGGFTDMLDAQRMLLDVRTMIAEARITREKSLVQMETLAGVDVETLAGPTTAPATTGPATTQASE